MLCSDKMFRLLLLHMIMIRLMFRLLLHLPVSVWLYLQMNVHILVYSSSPQAARDGGNSSQHSGSGNLPESDRVGSTLREVELQGRLSQALQENQEVGSVC